MQPLIRIGSALAILAVLAISARAAEPHLVSWTVDGIEREAIVFAPASPPKSGGSPLLFVFHGHGGNMRGAARNTKFQDAWPEAIVVYMQGLPTPSRVDPEGRRAGWQHLPGDNGDRDLKFFDTALAALRKKYSVDDNRIYSTGFSNGGFFTYLLWDQRPNTFAALAPCAGLPRPQLKLAAPKPAFIVAGEKDQLVKIADQQAAIERIRKLDSATADGKPADDHITVYDSDKGTPVQTLIHPGAHVLPPEAPRLIVEFFKAHELKK